MLYSAAALIISSVCVSIYGFLSSRKGLNSQKNIFFLLFSVGLLIFPLTWDSRISQAIISI